MIPLTSIARGLIVILFSFLAVPTASAQALDWELVNGFRFIHNRAKWDELRSVYESLDGNRTASRLERKLQDRDESRVDAGRESAKRECAAKSGSERADCERKSFLPYLGWFASLAEKDHEPTCWDSKARKFRESPLSCKNYGNPTSHRVRVWLTDNYLSGDSSLTWFLDDVRIVDFTVCDASYRRGACIEFSLPYDESVKHKIAVRSANAEVRLEADPIQVRDRLIVGLGDSFAAGEGNPDRPAQFVDSRIDNDFVYRKERWVKAPRRDKKPAVGWLDSRCHRSMYSYQFKTALQYSLANQKQAVTYVSFACSGAVTSDIFKSRQTPKEGLKLPMVPLQLDALKKVLRDRSGKIREIDYLLLSTGGNDVGFAPAVGYVVTTGWISNILEGRAGDVLKKPDYIEKELLGENAKAPGNYLKLRDALFDPQNGLKIKKCSNGTPCGICDSSSRCDSILLSMYPNMLTDEEGNLCSVTRREFDDPFKPDPARGERLKRAKEAVFDRLTVVQRTVPQKLGWSLVEEHASSYIKHGFCAQQQGTASVDEIFPIPRVGSDGKFHFDPREYRTYGSRARWARLPVDSKLSVDQRSKIFFGLSIDVGFEDDWGTIMHPTAQGLAVTADANLSKIFEIERKP